MEALTVSVNYSDYLGCILENQAQFDRWVIMTHEDDINTISLCELHGLEYHFSRRLYENGAVFNKAAALNEGLALLSDDSWRIVIDSDILLPADFRERLERLYLSEDCLYGVSGRIVCDTAEEFALRKISQPWHGAADMASFVIGYMQMFHAEFQFQSFPEKADDASTYDVLFCRQVPESRQKRLPFTVLHAGPSGQNWRGRESAPFFNSRGQLPDFSKLDLRSEIAALGYANPRVAIVGHGAYRLLKDVSPICRSVCYFDNAGILNDHPDPLWNESRMWWRLQFETCRSFRNVVVKAVHEASSAGEDFDILVILVEADYDFWLTVLSNWVCRLKPDSTICGLGYFERSPDTYIPINLLFGVPRQSESGNGFWSVSIKHPREFLARTFPRPARGEYGIIYIFDQDSKLEHLLVSLWSLRRHWDGPVAVLHLPPEDPSLRLACARMGVDCIPLPSRSSEMMNSSDSTMDAVDCVAALLWTPWPIGLYLACATFICRSVEGLLKATESSHTGIVRLAAGEEGPQKISDACFGFVRERFTGELFARHSLNPGELHVTSEILLRTLPFNLSEEYRVGHEFRDAIPGVAIVDLRSGELHDAPWIRDIRRELEDFFK